MFISEPIGLEGLPIFKLGVAKCYRFLNWNAWRGHRFLFENIGGLPIFIWNAWIGHRFLHGKLKGATDFKLGNL